MRWDNLFDDLESQLELELGAEDLDLVAEEERLRLGRLTLRDRLVALVGHAEPLHLVLRDGESVALRLTAAGRDWIAGDLLAAGPERTAAVVPIAAISSLVPSADQLARSIRAGLLRRAGDLPLGSPRPDLRAARPLSTTLAPSTWRPAPSGSTARSIGSGATSSTSPSTSPAFRGATRR